MKARHRTTAMKQRPLLAERNGSTGRACDQPGLGGCPIVQRLEFANEPGKTAFPFLAILLLSMALVVPRTSVAQQIWDSITRSTIYQIAYPIERNGKTIMLGARLQVPADVSGKMPAVIMMHGTGGIRYSGVY